MTEPQQDQDPTSTPAVATVCVGSPCTNEDHEHEEGHDDGWVQILCNDCGKPSHYDYGIDDYRHDDPAAPDCFLIRTGKTTLA